MSNDTINALIVGLISAYFPNPTGGQALPGLSLVRDVRSFHNASRRSLMSRKRSARCLPLRLRRWSPREQATTRKGPELPLSFWVCACLHKSNVRRDQEGYGRRGYDGRTEVADAIEKTALLDRRIRVLRPPERCHRHVQARCGGFHREDRSGAASFTPTRGKAEPTPSPGHHPVCDFFCACS